MGLERKKSSSRSPSRVRRKGRSAQKARDTRPKKVDPGPDRIHRYAICVRNDDYPASLELRKLYPVIDDDFGQQHNLIRVIDESGEDYLYPNDYFMRVELPRPVEQTLRRIA